MILDSSPSGHYDHGFHGLAFVRVMGYVPGSSVRKSQKVP